MPRQSHAWSWLGWFALFFFQFFFFFFFFFFTCEDCVACTLVLSMYIHAGELPSATITLRWHEICRFVLDRKLRCSPFNYGVFQECLSILGVTPWQQPTPRGTLLLHTSYCALHVCVCVCACVRACVCVCVRACVRACVPAYVRPLLQQSISLSLLHHRPHQGELHWWWRVGQDWQVQLGKFKSWPSWACRSSRAVTSLSLCFLVNLF